MRGHRLVWGLGLGLSLMTLLALAAAYLGVLCQWWGLGCLDPCGALRQVEGFGRNPGRLQMCVYVPDGLPRQSPLVVVLHGCSQGAEDTAKGAGWTEIADARGLALLLPQQMTPNNLGRCFNWFLPRDAMSAAAGGSGEAVSIREMIAWMLEGPYAPDPDRIYVSGFSAGGAMTAALLADYPSLFAAGAIFAGVPYGCASSTAEAIACMTLGRDLPGQIWAERISRAGMAAAAAESPSVKLSVWQGAADKTVAPLNAQKIVEGWLSLLDVDPRPDRVLRVEGARYLGYEDASGTLVVERYLIPGLGHAVPVDAAAGCGSPGRYFRDIGLCASRRIVDFWGL
ncbi:extracellular catalytic domain type 1 short-chain-length polyhydroxyalkanoate depolymerase [Thiorhodococcus minor]|uniref:PHB depolymerase family esterase n=1 Tax=Thiorhodococcus minor TaxID=57489 RepID=A0A6M0K506_9GAMM|nr:PHB depolymerase family esterase [Thiorhodococcus minor]NEV64371.1 PHB depolymerase family esterase [Thiorhodococcus minor]